MTRKELEEALQQFVWYFNDGQVDEEWISIKIEGFLNRIEEGDIEGVEFTKDNN